ncbi:MAG: purine-nucleoside phosphorylase [Actinobacteria bacterium]|nr:purine-nucleoside phosphorylase [Actinomycetota bacterium]
MIKPENIRQKAVDAAEYIRQRFETIPLAAVVLGSGWDALIGEEPVLCGLDFQSIPGFEETRVAGHRGVVQLVETGNEYLIVQQGRRHVYEGISPLEVCFSMWVFRELGIEAVVLLSAAGGLNPRYEAGDLILLYDHIYLFGENPLTGVPQADENTTFIAGAGIYSLEIEELLLECIPTGSRVERGVYVYVTGPSYETPAEARFVKLMGGDVVGMSTAPEAITAFYLGMKVGALCCVSNVITQDPIASVSHDDVLEVTRNVSRSLGRRFLENLAGKIDKAFEQSY